MTERLHDVTVEDVGDGFVRVDCMQTKNHWVVPSDRLRATIDRADDDCETEHVEVFV